jgi:hypothetical protein
MRATPTVEAARANRDPDVHSMVESSSTVLFAIKLRRFADKSFQCSCCFPRAEITEAWLKTYNQIRPHDALGRRPEAVFRARI